MFGIPTDRTRVSMLRGAWLGLSIEPVTLVCVSLSVRSQC